MKSRHLLLTMLLMLGLSGAIHAETFDQTLAEAKRGDELLNGEIFYTLREAQVLIEQWRVHYNTIRPHSALGYRPPAPETLAPIEELHNQPKAA
jgi:transposase InsO family protein